MKDALAYCNTYSIRINPQLLRELDDKEDTLPLWECCNK